MSGARAMGGSAGDLLGTGAGYAFACDSTRNLAAATDVLLADAPLLVDLVQRWQNCSVDKVQGRAFEFLHATKLNADAARKGLPITAVLTDRFNPHHPADIQVLRGVHLVKEIQAKSLNDKYLALRQLCEPKYDGMDLLVPADKADEWRRYAQEAAHRAPAGPVRDRLNDVADRITAQAKVDGAGSGGVTRHEARRAAEHPEAVARRMQGDAILREVGAATAAGTAVGGAFGLVFSAAGNARAVQAQDKSITEATVDTAAATATAALRGGAVAGGGKAISIYARQRGAATFAGGAGPLAVANGVWEAGGALNRYVRGEIDAAVLVEEVGTVVVRGTATFYGGVVGQMLIPIPVAGMLAGAIVGYTAGVVVNQAALLTLTAYREAGAAEARLVEVLRASREAVERMDWYRAEIDAVQERYALSFATDVLRPLDRLTAALVSRDVETAIQNLAAFNAAFGAALPFRDLAEFDDFMDDPKTALQL